MAVTSTLGVIVERQSAEGLLWNQTEGLEGLHETAEGAFRVVAGWEGVDHLLVFGTPMPEAGGVRAGRMTRWGRRLGLVAESGERMARCDAAWSRLFELSGLEREQVSCLFYEPPSMVWDEAYVSARRWAGRVFGPDDRAGVRTRLPAMWTLGESVRELRAMPPPMKSMRAAAVTSGKVMTPGHEDRMRFFRLLRDRGVPFDLFGRDLPDDVGGRGEVSSKLDVFGPAAYAIVVENWAPGRHYVTEKLWDALLSWCVPIYWGSEAADRMIPPEAMIRLPDLEEGGVRCVLDALADPQAYQSRLDALAEARKRALGDLRIVEWARHKLMGLRRPAETVEGVGDGDEVMT
ncbi:MAG: glycosyltransferase family 10 [Planctomycetota bacterium]